MKHLLSTTALIFISSLLTLAASANTSTHYDDDEVVVACLRLHPDLAQELEQFRGNIDQGSTLMTAIDLSKDTGFELPNFVRLQSKWKIRGVDGSEDLRRGDILEFDQDSLTIYRKSRSLTESDETEGYLVNEDQIYLQDSVLTLRYTFSKNGHLRLRHRNSGMSIRLTPVEVQ